MAVETDEDLRAVVKALQAWFVSQDIYPVEANAAMGELIAATFAWNLEDRGERQKVLNAFIECLRDAVERMALEGKRGA